MQKNQFAILSCHTKFGVSQRCYLVFYLISYFLLWKALLIMSESSRDVSLKKVILRCLSERCVLFNTNSCSEGHLGFRKYCQKVQWFHDCQECECCPQTSFGTKSPGILPTNNKITDLFKEILPADAMEFEDLPLHEPKEFF